MSFVFDASVAAARAFEDESGVYSDHVLATLGQEPALAPPIWPLEITNVLIGAERRGRIQPAATVAFLTLLESLPISVIATTSEQIMRRAIDLARTYNLTTYDASYLDLAMSHAVPLATLDNALRIAARRLDPACGPPARAPDTEGSRPATAP